MHGNRKERLDTQERLLEAASGIFSEKGFRKTTVADICRQAGANVAAVNYHFGGKKELYEAVWRNAFDEALRKYPQDGGLMPQEPAEDRLRAMVDAMINRLVDRGRPGRSAKLLIMELANPTGMIENIRLELIRPLREYTHNLMRELLGPDATDEHIMYCAMSVVHQCLALGFRLGQGRIFTDRKHFSEADTDAFVDHITRFSLAGIRGIRADLVNEARKATRNDQE